MAKEQLGELFYKITGDDKGLKKTINSSQKGMEGLGKKSLSIGSLIKGAFVVAAVAGIKRLGKELITAASDAEETRNKFAVTFRSVAEEAEAAANNLSTNFGLSGTAAKSLLADTGDLLSGFGFAGDEALSMSTKVNELAVDLASFTNFSGGAEGASAALTKGLLGEREALKSLGISISEADIGQLAEDKGIVGELDRQTKAQLTLELAMRQSGNAIGDFARSQDSFANRMRVAEANVDDLKVALGSNLLPVATFAVGAFNDMSDKMLDVTEKIKEFTTSAEGIDKISGIIAKVGASFTVLKEIVEPILDSLFEAFGKIIEPFQELGDKVENTGVGFSIMGGAIAAVAGVLQVISTVIAGTIEYFINLTETIIATAKLGGAAMDRLMGRISKEEFQKTLAGAGDAWKNFGLETIDNIGAVFADIGEVVSGFTDDATSSADEIALAYQTTYDKLKLDAEAALAAAAAANDNLVTDTEETTGELDEIWVGSHERYLERLDEQVEKEKDKLRQISSITSTVGDAIGGIWGSVNQTIDGFNQRELDAMQAKVDAEEEGTIKRGQLEEELNNKKKKIAKEQADREKALAIFSAVVNTAASIVKMLADPGGYAGVALAIVAGIAGAAQIAAIAAQPSPTFEQGGIVPELQGVPSTGDQQQINVNGGERIVPQDEANQPMQFTFKFGPKVFATAVAKEFNKGNVLIDLERAAM